MQIPALYSTPDKLEALGGGSGIVCLASALGDAWHGDTGRQLVTHRGLISPLSAGQVAVCSQAPVLPPLPLSASVAQGSASVMRAVPALACCEVLWALAFRGGLSRPV